MDSLFVNKVGASVLITGLLAIGLNTVSHSFFHSEEHEKMGYFVAIPESEAGGGAAPEAEGPVDLLAMMTAADPVAGQEVTVKCQQCHTFTQGGEALQGPNLYGVLGRPIASQPGFSYSDGENGLQGRADQVWDYAHLNEFLTRPRAYASNTAMNFVGLRREKDRADVMAYLRTLTDVAPYPMPDPLPAAEIAEESVDGAAEGESLVTGEVPVEPAAVDATPVEAPVTPAPEAPAAEH